MLGWPGMYRVVSIGLTALVILAALASGFGLVGFSPEGILGVTAVAILATLTLSWLGATVFKAPLHLESSLITGLLIGLIVAPTLQLRDLVGAAIAGAAAGASKWIIAPGGRHILNPAATGVVVASATGSTVGLWWVATPWLSLPVVAIGLAVAYRSGLTKPVAWFVVLGLSVLLARLSLSGEPLGQSAWLALTSYPVLFMGLFMVSEPLTHAVRKGDQFAAVAVMALMTSIPLSLSVAGVTLTSSPELAIVVGNLIAWLVSLARGQSRHARVQLHHSVALSESVHEYHFTLDRPLPLRAGEWVEIQLPHSKSDSRGQRRVFTVVSAPETAIGPMPTLTICTRVSPNSSSWKRALMRMRVDQTARISQVGGDFLLPSSLTGEVLMVAGGVGITPFVAHLRDVAHRSLPIRAKLVVVPSAPGEILYPELADYEGVDLVIVESLSDLSQHLPIDPLTIGWAGVCGSPQFVASARAVLSRAGVKTIHTDRFIGY